MNVHNHGPQEGPGIACPERLVGACLEAEQAAQNVALREAAERLEGFTRHMPACAYMTKSVMAPCDCGLSDARALLASPAPAVEAYAARLRREGAEAALDVERIAAALHNAHVSGCYCGDWQTCAYAHDIRREAAALRAAILAATPAGSEGGSDATL